MKKYICLPCGYIYNPEVGDPDEDIEPGTSFEDLPEDWVCPVCGEDKNHFAPLDEWEGKNNENTAQYSHCFLYFWMWFWSQKYSLKNSIIIM